MKTISKTEKPDKIPIPAYKIDCLTLVNEPIRTKVRPIREKIIKQQMAFFKLPRNVGLLKNFLL